MFDVLKSILDYKDDITTDHSFTNDKYRKVYQKMHLVHHQDIAKR